MARNPKRVLSLAWLRREARAKLPTALARRRERERRLIALGYRAMQLACRCGAGRPARRRHFETRSTRLFGLSLREWWDA